jgi:fimbrial chaperone protein
MNGLCTKTSLRRSATAALLAAMLLQCPGAWCGSLKVKPLKLYFDSGNTTATLTLTNEGTRKVSVQLSSRAWTQDEDGGDQYAPTDDIVVFPKIVSIDPLQERIVRVGFQGAPGGAGERAYRLYVQELPVENPGELAMKFVVRMGIPVFAQGTGLRRSWALDDVDLVAQGLNVPVNNTGNQHLKVGTLTVTGQTSIAEEAFSSSMQGWYVLPGNKRSFVVPLDRELCDTATSLLVAVTVAGETRQQQSALTSAYCAALESAIPTPH